jgi:DNA-binding transcriptional LysR family regulator
LNWDDLRIMIAVDEAGTLLGAAKTIGVSHSTIQRRLLGAEKALGVRLFRRRDGRLVRTGVAEDVLVQARRIEQDVASLTRSASSADSRLSGAVRVAAPLALVTQLLARQMRPLQDLHPGIRVILKADLRLDAMLRGEADIGIRVSMPVADRLDIRRVSDYRFGLYATPKIAADQLRALRLGETLPGPYVAFSDDHPDVPEKRWISEVFAGSEPTFQANTSLALLAAAEAGMGVAGLAEYIGDQSTKLQRIRVEHEGPSEGIFLVTHRDQRNLTRVRAVVDYLANIIRSEFP